MGVSCVGFDEQFTALVIAIEAGQPSSARSAAKKNRELKRLSCSDNYKGGGGNAFRPKGEEMEANSLL